MSRIRKYFFNEDYFREIDTPEKAYWLGFIYADSCIPKSALSHLEFGLCTKDRCILENFQKAIGSTYKIRDITSISKKTGRVLYESRLCVCSRKMTTDLNLNGIVSNKTYIAIFPMDVENKFISHYIRGVFDGDGCIRHDGLQVNICGLEPFCKWCKNIITENVEINGGVYKQDGTYIWGLKGRNQIKKFGEWLYKDSTIYLKRKFNIFKEKIFDYGQTEQETIIKEEVFNE